MVEQYDQYGEIKPQERRLSFDQEHRIHVTKDIFDGECSLCQQAAKQRQSHWEEDE